MKNILPSNQVERIIIKRDSTKGSYVTFAEIVLVGGITRKLKIGNYLTLSMNKFLFTSYFMLIFSIGNLDHFLEELENFQVRNGGASDPLIPITFQYNVEGSRGLDRFINLLLLAGVVYIFIVLSKDWKNAMSSMNKGSGGMGGDVFGVGIFFE